MIVYKNGKDVTREVIDRLNLRLVNSGIKLNWKDGTTTYKNKKGKIVTEKIEPNTKQ